MKSAASSSPDQDKDVESISGGREGKKEAEESLRLSLKQREVIDLVLQRESVFFTGAAGTGAAYLRVNTVHLSNLT